MQKSTSAAIAIGALLCVAAVVFIRQFGNPDPTDEGGPQGAALSVDDQGVVDALQKSVPVNYKAGDGGRVTLLAVHSPQMNDDLVGKLVKLTALRELQLVECVLGVEGIRAIASLPELESLRLEKVELGAGALQALAPAAKLRHLFLTDSQVDDEALASLGSLSNLELLELSRTDVTDAGLSSISGLTSLQKLYLSETGVTGEGFANFPESHGLALLNLSGCPVTSAGIDELKRFTALTSLYLDSVQFDDALVAHLMDVTTKSATELQGLFMSETPLTDSAIEPLKALAEFPNLSLVGLNNTRISKAAFRELAKETPETRYLVDYDPGED